VHHEWWLLWDTVGIDQATKQLLPKDYCYEARTTESVSEAVDAVLDFGLRILEEWGFWSNVFRFFTSSMIDASWMLLGAVWSKPGCVATFMTEKPTCAEKELEQLRLKPKSRKRLREFLCAELAQENEGKPQNGESSSDEVSDPDWRRWEKQLSWKVWDLEHAWENMKSFEVKTTTSDEVQHEMLQRLYEDVIAAYKVAPNPHEVVSKFRIEQVYENIKLKIQERGKRRKASSKKKLAKEAQTESASNIDGRQESELLSGAQ